MRYELVFDTLDMRYCNLYQRVYLRNHGASCECPMAGKSQGKSYGTLCSGVALIGGAQKKPRLIAESSFPRRTRFSTFTAIVP